MRAQHWEAAITACRRALALDANNYAALNNLGVALRASGRGAEGSRVLARAAQVSPDDTMARQNLSRAGIRAARITVMIVLIPVGFLTHLGFLLYGAFAVATNILISKRPDLVLRLERWAVPIALFVARRPRGLARTSSARSSSVEDEIRADRTWSAVEGKWQLRPWVILLGAMTSGTVAVVLAVLTAAAPGWDKLAVATGAVISAAVTIWLATVFVRRRA
jgi:hypothetical protein